ncbi:MAG: dihydrofolate reductase family protein [Flavisolibacter sp.]|jgi:dihydrofolate reductase|nr:dihydrofolate reductase family protein [Flavisolibacter sp.]
MGRLKVFNFISIDGYYKTISEDINWHTHGKEAAEYSAQSLQQSNILLYGRKTFQMMESFWPTKAAKDSLPEVREEWKRQKKLFFLQPFRIPTGPIQHLYLRT